MERRSIISVRLHPDVPSLSLSQALTHKCNIEEPHDWSTKQQLLDLPAQGWFHVTNLTYHLFQVAAKAGDSRHVFFIRNSQTDPWGGPEFWRSCFWLHHAVDLGGDTELIWEQSPTITLHSFPPFHWPHIGFIHSFKHFVSTLYSCITRIYKALIPI